MSSTNDRLIRQCEKLGLAPERVREALDKISLMVRARRHPEENIIPPSLTEEDERILLARADIQYLPASTGAIIGRAGVIDYPSDVADHDGYCRELMRSVWRKQAVLKDELMTPNEHRALGIFRGWYEMYKDTEESHPEGEQLALEAMPSVVPLTDATFDAAFEAYPLPTVVYFHEAKALHEPKASLRVEQLAQRVAPDGRVARVNITINRALWRRFKFLPKPEPLFLFDMNGFLKAMMSSEEPLDDIAAWFEPYVAARRKYLSKPNGPERLERLRASRMRVAR